MIIDMLLAFCAMLLQVQTAVLDAAWPDAWDQALNESVLGQGRLGGWYWLSYFNEWFPVDELSTVVLLSVSLGLFMVLYRFSRWAVEVAPIT